MTQKMFELSQKIPFPGKRRLRSEVAEAPRPRPMVSSYQDKVNEIRSKVIMGYWSLALTYAGFDITHRNKQFWEQVVQVAETRYSVGQGMQADVLQAQVELGSYLTACFQWTQKQESVQGDLNALRSKPPQTPIAKPQPLRPRPFNLKLDQLLALTEARPQLQALKTMVAKQEKAVDLARKDYFPDFTIGVNYGLRENREDLKRSDMFGTNVHGQPAHLAGLQNQAQDKGGTGQAGGGQRRLPVHLEPAERHDQGPACQAAASEPANNSL